MARLYVSRALYDLQKVDTLSVGEQTVPIENWEGTCIRNKHPERQPRDVVVDATVDREVLEVFAEALREGSMLIPEDFSPERTMDLWLLCSVMGHQNLQDDVARRLINTVH